MTQGQSVEPITVQEPFRGAEIVRELRALHARSREIWDSFSNSEFFFPPGDAWSPADNVRHLLKSNRPVLRAPRSLAHRAIRAIPSSRLVPVAPPNSSRARVWSEKA